MWYNARFPSIYGSLTGEDICCLAISGNLFEANGPGDLFRVLNKEEIDPSDNWTKDMCIVALLQVNENSFQSITHSQNEGTVEDTYRTIYVHSLSG